MKTNKQIGLIGVGNMGTAILEGLLKKGIAEPGQIIVFDKLEEKAKDFSRSHGVACAASNSEVVSKADGILLAIKPQDLGAFASEVKTDLDASKTVMSILAGMTISKLQENLGKECELVRAMPNLGAKVGASVTALTGGSQESLDFAQLIFSGCGETLNLEEKHFDLVTAVSGSGPAYFFYLMEYMMKAAELSGISAEDAKKLVIQTALGSALLAESSEENPSVLRARVTSKGGTTQAALEVLDQQAVDRIIIQAVEAARRRGEELRN